MIFFSRHFVTVLCILFFSTAKLFAQFDSVTYYKQTIRTLNTGLKGVEWSFTLPVGTKIDSLIITQNSIVNGVVFNSNLSRLSLRIEEVSALYLGIAALLTENKTSAEFKIYCLGKEISELIPNYYRKYTDKDSSRQARVTASRYLQVVENISKPVTITHGLQGNNIILWQSHGWYYNADMQRWEWQRPRLFQCVEDLLPLSFVLPYITPMLENAGANVYLPRERDIQTNEVVVDNDGRQDVRKRAYIEIGFSRQISSSAKGAGFAFEAVLDSAENPFTLGTYRIMHPVKSKNARVVWNPDIPEKGEYAVYISYKAFKQNTAAAKYVLTHAGGVTEFRVNQQIGGSTWFYLGTFTFFKGKAGKLELFGNTPDGGLLTADAVRFGGGMGNVTRGGSISGRPRFMEGARYWLQYAGMPDSLVYHPGKNNDYTDDYVCRAEYGNYLAGAPFGPKKDTKAGLGIPMHLSLAFHTDAGITKNDSVFGALSIYSLKSATKSVVFPDSVSRYANRDFADILLTEIVTDVQRSFDPNWVRRQLRDDEYSEATRPNMPSALLELLSHQNFKDMQYALDPKFRWTVSRAIYKAMLKFLADSEKRPYVVQPLPVIKPMALLQSDAAIHVSWAPQYDSAEATANPTGYVVYQRLGDGGFDNGTFVADTVFVVKKVKHGELYSFKICAVNAGGESMPSEIVCAGAGKHLKQVLVVNGFNRTSAPAYFSTEKFAGFADFLDEGVPDKYTVSYTGPQYDFNPDNEWITNDIPGFGASAANYEGMKIAGNSFDNIYTHGTAILNAGYSFSACSESALSLTDIQKYVCVDLIYGEQKETTLPVNSSGTPPLRHFATFPSATRAVLSTYLTSGGSLFVSGAYIGSDVFHQVPADSDKIHFVMDYLGYQLQAVHASKTGIVYRVGDKGLPGITKLQFNTVFSPEQYKVEAPDALLPVGGAVSLMQYHDNRFSAAVHSAKYRVLSAGFPFESLQTEKERNAFFQSVMQTLLK